MQVSAVMRRLKEYEALASLLLIGDIHLERREGGAAAAAAAADVSLLFFYFIFYFFIFDVISPLFHFYIYDPRTLYRGKKSIWCDSFFTSGNFAPRTKSFFCIRPALPARN